MTRFIHPVFWLWLPVFFALIQIGLEVTLPRDALSAMLSEQGPHEFLQFLVIFTAMLFALSYFFSKDVRKSAFNNFWFGLAFICCAYVAGEEMSWGQHVFEWGTPEYWSGINDQQETNMHNTSSWLDQKPRLLLLIGIVAGSLILPYMKKERFPAALQRLWYLLPDKRLGVIALLVIVPQIAEKLFELFGISLFVRYSEVQELFMFYFVLLYLISLYHRLRIAESP
jgi:hypothetical protein